MVADQPQNSHLWAPFPELWPLCEHELARCLMHNASWRPIFSARDAITFTLSVEKSS